MSGSTAALTAVLGAQVSSVSALPFLPTKLFSTSRCSFENVRGFASIPHGSLVASGSCTGFNG